MQSNVDAPGIPTDPIQGLQHLRIPRHSRLGIALLTMLLMISGIRRPWRRVGWEKEVKKSKSLRLKPPTPPKIASNSRGALREASKTASKGTQHAVVRKARKPRKNHGFSRKTEATKHPQHPIKPSRARIIGPSFSHGARARPKPRFSRFGGGTGSPKPGEHHEHQQPWPAGPRQ